jgi:hypothetical protein
MSRNISMTFLIVATLVIGSPPGLNALADDAPPSMPAAMRNVLIWDQDESGHMVDVEAAKSMNANVVNVAAVPHGVGTWIGSVKPLAAYKKGLQNAWKADLAELNKAGIAVWTSVNTTAFEPDVFKKYGLDPERYYCRNDEGKPQQHLGGAYSKEGKVFSSCPNNPHWMALERDITMLFAENGFAGMFYDVGVLADDAVMFCHCEHCQAKWKKHLADKGFDPQTPMPVSKNGRDITKAVNRDHLRWRYACIEEDWMLVRNAVKAKYPDFVLGPNSSDKATDNTAAAAIMGRGRVYDFLDFEEWGHGGAPFSIAPSYLLGRADGNGKPVIGLWNGGNIQSPVQAKIALAEATAMGEHCQNSVGAREYNDFLKRHEEYFGESTSAASVGIVYSAWSREFYDVPRNSHAYYWFGQMLLDMHVPFEYLMAEHDLTPQSLSRYKALILPDVGCLSNNQISALSEYMKGGGAIYATHGTGKFDDDLQLRTPSAIEALGQHSASDPFRMEIGSGRFAYNPNLPEKDYWDANSRDLEKSKNGVSFPSPPPADVKNALDWVFQNKLPIEIDAKSSTAVTLHRQKDRMLVHLVNYNAYPDGKQLTPDLNIAIRVSMPPESSVTTVRAISPDYKEDRTLAGWKLENGKLSLALDELESYTVIIIELKPSTPTRS